MKKLIFILLLFPTLLMGQIVETKTNFIYPLKSGDTLKFRETFSDSPVNATHPIGWTLGTGSYAVKELSAESGLPYFNVGDKYLECTSDGTIAVQSNQAYGDFYYSFYKGSEVTSLKILFIAEDQTLFAPFVAGNKGYGLEVNASEIIYFYDSNGTTRLRTSAGYVSANTWYDLWINRTISGVFTVYIKGGSFGNAWNLISIAAGSNPFTDNTITTSNLTVLDFDGPDAISNFKYKR